MDAHAAVKQPNKPVYLARARHDGNSSAVVEQPPDRRHLTIWMQERTVVTAGDSHHGAQVCRLARHRDWSYAAGS
jgi:hypothetical protein